MSTNTRSTNDGYTRAQIENGDGCYSGRSTYLYTDGTSVYTTDTRQTPVAGAWFCGRRDTSASGVDWC